MSFDLLPDHFVSCTAQRSTWNRSSVAASYMSSDVPTFIIVMRVLATVWDLRTRLLAADTALWIVRPPHVLFHAHRAPRVCVCSRPYLLIEVIDNTTRCDMVFLGRPLTAAYPETGDESGIQTEALNGMVPGTSALDHSAISPLLRTFHSYVMMKEIFI